MVEIYLEHLDAGYTGVKMPAAGSNIARKPDPASVK